jgi:transposase
MRPKGSADRLEYRRQLASRLLDEGQGINEVARLVAASPSSVHRWKEQKAQYGEAGLNAKPHPGRGCQLTDDDKEQLTQILVAGPMAAGYDTALWTCARVAQVIQRRFGISYHPDHVGRLLHGLGFSCQYPEQQARERNEEAIRQWRLEEWSRIKKKPSKKRRRLP